MKNKVERVKMVKAMEFIVRQINDEDVFENWLLAGVADGDIEYGDLSIDTTDLEPCCDMAYYTKSDIFSSLMETFLSCMAKAKKSGGLYCDGIVSK